MTLYRPETPFQHALALAARLPGYPGRTAARKLRRRYIHRAMADFEERLKGVGPGDICLDLGANVGDFTRRLAATGAVVHAYEPDPDTFAALEANTAGLPNVIRHQQAVAATAGQFTLHRLPESTPFKVRSLGSSILAELPRKDDSRAVTVQVVAFRDVLTALPGRAAIIKMDIEGAEVAILEDLFAHGGTDAFDALYVETHERQYPAQAAAIRHLHGLAAASVRPAINLYWQ